MMNLYRTLDIGPLKKSYSAKMLLLGFLGIHIPLIGIIMYILLVPKDTLEPWQVIVITLILTLLATAITLYLLNALLSPIRITAEAITTFQHQRQLPSLPTEHQDEAGLLMANIQNTMSEIKRLGEDQLNFFSLLIHDLRSPLNSIVGLTELITVSDNEQEREEYLGLIRDSCEKGLQVVHDTMHLIMNENYQLKENDKQLINLSDFLTQQLRAVEGIRLGKNINIELSNSDSDQLLVQPELFSHIIQNLLTNAIKFSHQGGTIKVEGKPQQDIYHLSVSDEGLGFRPEVRDKLFDRFTSEKKKGTKGEATSGIGLYLTKTLVEKHGGSIEADSPGISQGATFTLKVPHVASQNNKPAQQSSHFKNSTEALVA